MPTAQPPAKLLPFDINQALTARVVTRNGDPVEILAVRPELGAFSVVGIHKRKMDSWRADGSYFLDGLGKESDLDLFILPPPSDRVQRFISQAYTLATTAGKPLPHGPETVAAHALALLDKAGVAWPEVSA